MGRQFNWEKHGYETAKGKRGTGWMAFTDYALKELIEEYPIEKYPDGIPVEAIDDHAHGWLETLQFNYEAGEDMKLWAEREAKKEGNEEDWIYGFGEKESEWEYGYVNYMTELMIKEKIKIDDQN